MSLFLNAVAVLISKVAVFGAGFLSLGALYQPERPEGFLEEE